MSVAEDGNEQEQPGETPRRADRAARHRVPPTASATAKVPLLPEPFNPAKPTFPAGAAIPRQRRGGPTAIATASIPTVPVADDETFLAGIAELAELAGLADEPDQPDASDQAEERDGVDELDEPDEADEPGLLRPVEEPEELEDAVGAAPPVEPAAEDVDDPATVGTLAGEIRASAAETPAAHAPAAPDDGPVEAPLLVDPAAFADPDPDAQPVGVAPVMMLADDSPTVADYVPPAFAIVTDDPGDEDGPDYRGSRRRIAAWRRYPVGAVAVAVLILLVTAAVVLQLVRSTGDNPTPTAGVASPQRFPGVGGLPELTKDAASPSPSTVPTSASPSPSRSRTSAPAAPPASASASPTRAASSPPAPPPPLTGQLRGAGSAKCLEYRAGENNRAVIDNCDSRGSGRSNQRWTFASDGSVRADGGCLDVQNAGTGNGNAVQLYGCNGTAAQKWTLRGDGTLLNPRSGRCLDVANGGTGAGSPVIIWDCSAASNQKWSVQAY